MGVAMPRRQIVSAAISAGDGDNARRTLVVQWDDGARASLNVLWLRTNCPDVHDRMAAGECLSVADLDPGLRLEQVEVADDGALQLHFSDRHRARIDAAWLYANAPPHRRRTLDGVLPWRAPFSPQDYAYADVVDSPIAHAALLEDIVRSGVALVTGVPGEAAATERLAQLFGYIRHTDFGRLFDIVTERRAWTASQSADALDPHTDDPYRYTPSGASLLHCVAASEGGGGDSIIVDGFAVAAELRQHNPDAFGLLADVDVPFVYKRDQTVAQGDAVHLRAHAPVIRLDRVGEVVGIRFHERAMAPLDLDDDLIEVYYRALAAFIRLIRSERFQMVRRLCPGEALLFDNQRVLHGRTAFHGDAGRRHLRLCTVDRDQFHSTLRRLREATGRGDPHGKLAAGNLA